MEVDFQKIRACGATYCAISRKKIVTIEVVAFYSSRLR
jgi:aerobic-type carbon monoxide dehydrogenase small subunit (CoxS/CutS family)